MNRNKVLLKLRFVWVNDSQILSVVNTMSSCQDVFSANQNASARVVHVSVVVITQAGHPRPSTFHQKTK